jgi:hypothetical protein
MEENECGKLLGNEILKAAFPIVGYDGSKPIGECGIFPLFR